MTKQIYLIVSRGGSIRHTINLPRLARDEIAIKLSVTIPSSAFRSPIVEASLDVKDQEIIVPTVSVEVINEEVKHADTDGE